MTLTEVAMLSFVSKLADKIESRKRPVESNVSLGGLNRRCYPSSLAHLCKHLDRLDALEGEIPIPFIAELLEISVAGVYTLCAAGVLPPSQAATTEAVR